MAYYIRKYDEPKFRNWLEKSNRVQLKIRLDDPASEISNSDLVELSRKLCNEDGAYTTLIDLSGKFGTPYSVLVSIQNGSCSETDQMLKLLQSWITRDGSTVRMLIMIMKSMGKQDCADYIENVARHQYTTQYFRLHVTNDGKENVTGITSENVPGKKTLEQHIETEITEIITANYPRGLRHCYIIKLKELEGVDWNSTANEYVGRQIELYLYCLTKEGLTAVTNDTEHQRNGRVLENTASNNSRTLCPNLYFGLYASEPKTEESKCGTIQDGSMLEHDSLDESYGHESLQTAFLSYLQEQENESSCIQDTLETCRIEDLPESSTFEEPHQYNIESLNDSDYDFRSDSSTSNSPRSPGSSRKNSN